MNTASFSRPVLVRGTVRKERILSLSKDRVERLIMTARVEQEDAKYVALIEGPVSGQVLVRGEGESPIRQGKS